MVFFARQSRKNFALFDLLFNGRADSVPVSVRPDLKVFADGLDKFIEFPGGICATTLARAARTHDLLTCRVPQERVPVPSAFVLVICDFHIQADWHQPLGNIGHGIHFGFGAAENGQATPRAVRERTH